MADYAAQVVSRAGLVPTMNAAAAGGDTTPVGDHIYLMVTNGGASSVTVTVTTPGTEGGLAIADLTVAVAAGATSLIGPLVPELFQDPADNKAHVSWSATTSVTFAVISA